MIGVSLVGRDEIKADPGKVGRLKDVGQWNASSGSDNIATGIEASGDLEKRHEVHRGCCSSIVICLRKEPLE